MAKKAAKKATAKAKGKSSPKTSPEGIQQLFGDLKEAVQSMDEDIRKFTDEEVRAAGARARKTSLIIRKGFQQLRKDLIMLDKVRRGTA